MSAYQSTQPTGRDGFAALLRAEWTKFRSVRGWLIASALVIVLMIVFGLLSANGSHGTIQRGPNSPVTVGHPYVPIGPGGEAVTDQFTFAHQSLDGNGSITARVSSLLGTELPNQMAAGQPAPTPTVNMLQPWSKAGLIIKANTSQGSAYAAIMITGGHGVRMQYNFTGDIAGPAVPAGSPEWLRLARSGDTVTGYASADGSSWTTVGSVQLAGLPSAAPVGMFVASPAANTFTAHFGGGTGSGASTLASARFDGVALTGQRQADAWTATDIGGDPNAPLINGASGLTGANGVYTVTGNGDIAPDLGGTSVESTLVGAFAALLVLAVLGVLFISTEYRRGLIRTSLTASPRRGRVLAAKAVVLGWTAFVTGLVGTAITIPIGEHLLRVNGNFINPITALTETRIIVGTGALLAIATVLALAIGTIMRRSAAAVATAIVVVVLPYILGTAGVLGTAPAQWLLRVTPAAAFAIQQSIPAYHQVDQAYTPVTGFYPLAPWTGFAVLCVWAAVALGVAGYLLRRRDA
jgi:ABC-type transport system involved in multi-copper enzyme maturation permease subunit